MHGKNGQREYSLLPGFKGIILKSCNPKYLHLLGILTFNIFN
jgi:hypothetical protein